MSELTEFLVDNEFFIVDSQESWDILYPPWEWGVYTLSPSDTPENYPCWVKTGDVEVNPNGRDIRHVCIVYEKSEETE